MRRLGNGFMLVAGGIYAVGMVASTVVLAASAVLVSGLGVPCLGIPAPERAAAEVVERRIARESEAGERHRDRPVFVVRVGAAEASDFLETSGYGDPADFIVTTARGARYAVRESIFQRGPCSGMRIYSADEPA